MERIVFLDTETTGLAIGSDRVIEVAAVEVVKRKVSGEFFQTYINPQYPVSSGAYKIHGLSDEFLSDKPTFDLIIEPLMEFIGASPVYIHNARFDRGMLDHEFRVLRRPTFSDTCAVVCTLVQARAMRPGQKNSLDSLAKHYQVVAKERELHGALEDSRLLAEVWLEMTAGQFKMWNEEADILRETKSPYPSTPPDELGRIRAMRPEVVRISPDELSAHERFLQINKLAPF